MAVVARTEIEYDHFFDAKTNRHQINGVQSVLHCHHYTSLYTQLAIDAGETELLKECARQSFRIVLDNYFANHPELDSTAAKNSAGLVAPYLLMTDLLRFRLLVCRASYSSLRTAAHAA